MAAGIGGYSLRTVLLLLAGMAVLLALSTPKQDFDLVAPGSDMDDSLTPNYSPALVAAYWARRPVAVARRSMTVALAAAGVGIALAMDKLTGMRLGVQAVRSTDQARVLHC